MDSAENKLIIVTGPESTGKTSVATYLAAKYNGEYIAEYARKYIADLNRKYNYNDILHIAEYQRKELAKAYNSKVNKIWFIDTYLIITKIWFNWYAKIMPEWIDEAIYETKDSLYLLCAPDIEWQADDVRENGGVNRLKLFEAYKHELESNNLTFRIVTGKNDDRYQNAINFVEKYLD